VIEEPRKAGVPTPAPRPTTASGHRPRPASVASDEPIDRLLLQLTAAQLGVAVQSLGTHGVKNLRIDGDAVEFECPRSHVNPILRGLLDSQVEIYGLARMSIGPVRG
jgi:hypothetical protein